MRLMLILFLTLASLLRAQTTDASPVDGMIILPAQEVYEGDYFAWGRAIEISGTVNGDVYLIGAQIHIDGTVNGSVLALGGSIDISGYVKKGVRLMAGQVMISGQVEDSVSCLCGSLHTVSTGLLDNNLVATAGNIDLTSPIQGTATLMAANVRVSSNIGDNLQGYIGKLRVTSKAVINGNLDYRSSSSAMIDPGALIRGEIIYHPSLVHHLVDLPWIHELFVGSQVLVILMNFIYTLVMGFLIFRFFPASLRHSLDLLSSHPWKSFVYGLLFIVVMPLLILLLIVTVLGVPLALTIMAFNIFGVYTGKVYSIFWISEWSMHRWKFKRLWAFFLFFTILYFLLVQIPFVGSAIAFVILLFGLGCALLGQMKRGIFPMRS